MLPGFTRRFPEPLSKPAQMRSSQPMMFQKSPETVNIVSGQLPEPMRLTGDFRRLRMRSGWRSKTL